MTMTIIEHLERTVSPAVLGEDTSINRMSLLEQCYALIISRLATPQVYRTLFGYSQSADARPLPKTLSFEQLWPSHDQRALILNELSATYHMDKMSTNTLLTNATPMTYRALIEEADGQLLSDYLQRIAPQVRPYLPVWATAVLTDDPQLPIDSAPEDALSQRAKAKPSMPVMIEEDIIHTDNIQTKKGTAAPTIEPPETKPTTTVMPDTNSMDTKAQALPQSHAQRHGLWVRLALLVTLIAALAVLWLWVIAPNQTPDVEPLEVDPTAVSSDPVVVDSTSEIEPAAELVPMELIAAVDDSGNLYTCTASVGSTAMQSALEQVLTTNFGDQANMCEISVDDKRAPSLPLSSQALSDSLTRLRGVPFARLHLQNERITLEAPNDAQLQQLLTDMQAIAPTISIMAAAPLPLPSPAPADNNQVNDAQINDAVSNEGQTQDERAAIPPNYPSTDPALAPRSTTSMNPAAPPPSPLNNSGADQNSLTAPTRRPANGLSLSEVEDLANSTIVAEELRGARPVDDDIASPQ